jgi:transposase
MSHIHRFKAVVLVVLNMLILFFYHLFSCFYKRMFQINRNSLKIIILHEYKQKHSATKTADIINMTWGAGTVSLKTVYNWFNKFNGGDMSLEEKEGCGRPSVVKDAQLKRIVEANPRNTTVQFAARLDVGTSTIKRALKRIDKVRIRDEVIPYDLTESQSEKRLEKAMALLQRFKKPEDLNRIVTCDEK